MLVLEFVAVIEEVAVDKRWGPHQAATTAMSNFDLTSILTNPPAAGKRAVLEHPHFAAENSM